jgi:hypothetical protein
MLLHSSIAYPFHGSDYPTFNIVVKGWSDRHLLVPLWSSWDYTTLPVVCRLLKKRNHHMPLNREIVGTRASTTRVNTVTHTPSTYVVQHTCGTRYGVLRSTSQRISTSVNQLTVTQTNQKQPHLHVDRFEPHRHTTRGVRLDSRSR